MSKAKNYFIVALLAAVLFSCAENKHNEVEGLQTQSFEAWMAKYASTAEKMPEGYYIEYYHRAPDWESLPAIDPDSSWVRINYAMSTLQGNIFETRDSLTARMLGTWAPTTHFVDDFISGSSVKLCTGLTYALNNMRVGDSARVYIPTELGYNSSVADNVGYMGSEVTYVGVPVYVDIALKEIVNDPYEWELDNLNKWVADNWGLTIEDTISTGLYMRIIKANPTGDTLTTDSLANFNYSSFFLDGQLINTSIQSVADSAGYNDGETSYYYQTLTTEGVETGVDLYPVFADVIQDHMRKGESAEAVAASWYANGVGGDIAATPQLLPYQSHKYVITVLTDEEVQIADDAETGETEDETEGEAEGETP